MATATKTTPAVSNLKQYIGGKWVEGSHAGVVESVNPADTRDVVARFKNASKADATRAIDAAQKAAAGWAKTPAPQRGRVLAKVAEIARRRRDELAALMTREQGKILAEAKGEMDKGTTLIDWYAGERLRYMGTSSPSELPGNFLYTMREPRAHNAAAGRVVVAQEHHGLLTAEQAHQVHDYRFTAAFSHAHSPRSLTQETAS